MLREKKMQKITSQILNTKRVAIIYFRTNSLFCAIIFSCFLFIVFVAILRSIWIKANWNELAYVSYCVSIAISREDTNKNKTREKTAYTQNCQTCKKKTLCFIRFCWSQVYPHPRIWVLVVREYNRFHFGDIDWHLYLFFFSCFKLNKNFNRRTQRITHLITSIRLEYNECYTRKCATLIPSIQCVVASPWHIIRA